MDPATGTSAPDLLPQDLIGRQVGRFAIHAMLGSGGMGEVYYADDTKLQRPVALKRMTRELAGHPEGRRRIVKEAQRASILVSEHIAGIYDILEEDHEVFLVMEYVEGITLRRRLQCNGRLGVGTAVKVAVECAEALKIAHQNGVVHRDIKPENIMITPAGEAKILDFGLARRLAAVNHTSETASSTQTNVCSGTVGYMAPEVLLEHDLDARSDIFSLGVVLYEMLTGQHPFEAKKAIATADHILHDAPRRVGEIVHDVSEELDRIASRMLAKEPGDRYSNAAELLTDLNAVQGKLSTPALLPPKRLRFKFHFAFRAGIYFGLILVVMLLATPVVRQLWMGKTGLPARKHVAVLPFRPAGEDAQARAFCQGLTETLTAKLVQLTARHPLQVVAPGDVREVAAASVGQARTELGVNLVIEGSFHQLGDKMRVTYNLVDARTSRVLRADAITAAASDPFSLEEQVVESAVRALDVELTNEERQALAAHGTNQPQAYDFYLRGRGYLQDYQKMENIDSAIGLFQRALQTDPKFALAYSGLGESYWQKYDITHERSWVAKALEACQQANVEGEGSNCLGMVYNGTGKYEQAATEFQRTLQRDPTNDDAYRGLATSYERLRKPDDAEQTYRQAISVRPEYWAGYSWLGAFLYHQARYEEAAKAFAQATALAPDNARAYSNLGGTYLALGKYTTAIDVFEQSVKLSPTADGYSNLGMAYWYLHRFPEAGQACEQAVQLAPGNYLVWENLADSYYWQAERRLESLAGYHKAIALAEEQLRVNPQDATALSHLALYHAMLGEKAAAWSNLREALARAPNDAEVRFQAALVENQIGDAGRTLGWLRKALDAGESPVLVRDHPNLDNLHSKKQFQQLLKEKSPEM